MSHYPRARGDEMFPDDVQIRVRARHLHEVMALRDSLEQADEHEGEVTGSTEIDPSRPSNGKSGRPKNNGGGVVWPAEDYAAFQAAEQESYRRVRAFADQLAARPGRWLKTSEVTELAGVTNTQLRAALGKFSMWQRANTDAAGWPFAWEFGAHRDPDAPYEFHYSMSPEQADAWLAAG